MPLRNALVPFAVLLSLVLAASPAMAACTGPSLFEGFPVPMGHDATELAIGDLDNDGQTDLITVSKTAGSIQVRFGNGNGTFDSALTYYAPSPEEIAVGDLNGDDFPDLVVSSEPGTNAECISFGSCAGFSILLNEGDGSFGAAATTPVPFAESVVSVDIAHFSPNDGQVDILVGAPPLSSTDPAIHVFHGAGKAEFPERTSWAVDGPLFDAEAAAINVPSGELMDVVAIVGPGTTSTFSRALLYSGGAGGTPTSRLITTDAIVDGEVATGDFNRDGAPDVAAMARSASQSYIIFWLQNTFESSSALAHTSLFTDLAVADVDEDGDVDVMTAQNTKYWKAFRMNNQMPVVPEVEEQFDDPAATTTRVIADDFNRDGRMDFFYLDTTNDAVRVLSNTCTDRYATITLSSTPNPSVSGGNVTFTVSLQQREHAPTPTGNVTLYEGSTVLGTGTLNDAGNAFINVSTLSPGTHTVHAVYEGGGGFGPQTSANYVHTVSPPPFGAPTNVVATGNGAANQITITWTATSETQNYDVLRRTNGGWSVIATVGGPPYVDTNVVNTSAYAYAVRSRHTNGTVSGESNVDVATTATLVLPGDNKIRATDITTTRSLINSLRVAAGLAAFNYTDPSLTNVAVKAIHFTELRDSLNPARTLLALAPVTFPNTVATGQLMRKSDIQTLRNSFQ